VRNLQLGPNYGPNNVNKDPHCNNVNPFRPTWKFNAWYVRKCLSTSIIWV